MNVFVNHIKEYSFENMHLGMRQIYVSELARDSSFRNTIVPPDVPHHPLLWPGRNQRALSIWICPFSTKI